MIYAGDLTEKLVIEAGVETQVASGGVKVDWNTPTVIAERWAAVVPRTSRRFEALHGQHQEMTAAYLIRGRCAVRPGQRIRHSGRYLDVIGVIASNGRAPEVAAEITLVCRGRQ
ncbi:MAG: hypothetical protein A2107_08185 [Verrucomicrobia bacterium GWF2_62_7]|nr:MAG: hypothetical protein A2107_08185 [Verrucomicrobia bacterium GWF2_62_7]